jgi:hypothetical protein
MTGAYAPIVSPIAVGEIERWHDVLAQAQRLFIRARADSTHRGGFEVFFSTIERRVYGRFLEIVRAQNSLPDDAVYVGVYVSHSRTPDFMADLRATIEEFAQ